MITWLPASVSFVERLSCCPQKICNKAPDLFFTLLKNVDASIRKFVIAAVSRLPYLWLLLFGKTDFTFHLTGEMNYNCFAFNSEGTLGIVSGVAVFYWPKLQLPDSPDFKVFADNHPFEVYDSQYKNMFWFEKTYTVGRITQRVWISEIFTFSSVFL